MNSQTHPANHSSVAAQDSSAQIIRPAVEIPKKIEIKVDRPEIKLLPLEPDSSSSQRRNLIVSKKGKVQADTNTQQTEEDVLTRATVPDTLDNILISDWKSTGFKKQLWSSETNDSLCIVPLFKNKKKKLETKIDSIPSHKENVEEVKSNYYTEEEPGPQFEYHSELRTDPWFISTLLFFVAITGIVRLKWQKYLNQVFHAIIFSNLAIKLQTSSENSQKPASILLNLLFYGNFSIFLYEFMLLRQRTFFDLYGWKLWLVILGFLLVVFNSKMIVYRFVGWIFRIQDRTTDYLFRSAVMNKSFGVILMPLIVLFPFITPDARHLVPKIGFLIFILLYLTQITRGIVANLRDTLSGYYIILYLCALEILPLSILYKVLFN
ncbi:DUF4271 domain-containing protein [Thermophagus sp. OGC60D27]|uniref:DUF4271 domain-containing protein n=1 Tax=Thermophagus sp. OGC60D27 TaxID=3458415 RepID=UPI0040379A5E